MDIGKIKAEYLKGGVSLQQLSEKHGVSLSKLKRVAAREKWTELLNQKRTKVNQKVVERMADIEASNTALMTDLWGQLAKLTQQSMSEMVDVSPAGLEHYANTLTQLQKGLGVKDQLDIEEQNARIAKLRCDAAKAEQASKPAEGIQIILPDELEEDPC